MPGVDGQLTLGGYDGVGAERAGGGATITDCYGFTLILIRLSEFCWIM